MTAPRPVTPQRETWDGWEKGFCRHTVHGRTCCPSCIKKAILEERAAAIKECQEITVTKEIFHQGHAGDFDAGAYRCARELYKEFSKLLPKDEGASKS